jgi:hypothetical protein
MPARTRTGARLAPPPPEPDPIEERMAALDAAKATYEEAAEDAWNDYRARSAELWLAYRQRADGATADYQAHVEAIRAGREP